MSKKKVNWRPEGWEEIKRTYNPNYPQLFEAGADAILEALIEKGEHFSGKFKAINFPTEMPAGTFIYILDEEESYVKSEI